MLRICISAGCPIATAVFHEAAIPHLNAAMLSVGMQQRAVSLPLNWKNIQRSRSSSRRSSTPQPRGAI